MYLILYLQKGRWCVESLNINPHLLGPSTGTAGMCGTYRTMTSGLHSYMPKRRQSMCSGMMNKCMEYKYSMLRSLAVPCPSLYVLYLCMHTCCRTSQCMDITANANCAPCIILHFMLHGLYSDPLPAPCSTAVLTKACGMMNRDFHALHADGRHGAVHPLLVYPLGLCHQDSLQVQSSACPC